MTSEGMLARGKANFEANRFLNNSETLSYIASMHKEKPKKEKEDAKPKSG